MIPIEAALKLIAENKLELGTDSVEIQNATGRVLAENITADRPLPPYDRVTMDGIAISYFSYKQGQKSFKVEAVCPAGTPQMTLQNKEQCIEVMTGCSLPNGTDTVIRYEDLAIENGVATIQAKNVREQQNVHFKGSDVLEGSLLLESGVVLSAAEISICATVGKHAIECKALPKTVVITTGDELVDIDASPQDHQIRKSNGQTVASLLKKWSIDVSQVHLEDDKQKIKSRIQKLLSSNNLIILSGGVSKGKFDFIPEVMEELGVDQLFHKVQQRPGKPLWFGRKDDCVVFGLPGNPVSSFISARKYIYYWLENSLGVTPFNTLKAVLAQDFSFKPDLHLYLPVKIFSSERGELMAQPYSGNGSGDLVNMKNADGILELPQGKTDFHKGEVYSLITYRDLL